MFGKKKKNKELEVTFKARMEELGFVALSERIKDVLEDEFPEVRAWSKFFNGDSGVISQATMEVVLDIAPKNGAAYICLHEGVSGDFARWLSMMQSMGCAIHEYGALVLVGGPGAGRPTWFDKVMSVYKSAPGDAERELRF